MMKLEYQYDETHEKITFEIPLDAGLPEVLENFERFIRASTYCFTGRLAIVEDEETPNDAA